jgi:hypothetical protein
MVQEARGASTGSATRKTRFKVQGKSFKVKGISFFMSPFGGGMGEVSIINSIIFHKG